jgi:hypothetical protein
MKTGSQTFAILLQEHLTAIIITYSTPAKFGVERKMIAMGIKFQIAATLSAEQLEWILFSQSILQEV